MFVIASISATSCTYKSCVFSIFALFRNTCNKFLLDKGFKGHHDIIVCYFRLFKILLPIVYRSCMPDVVMWGLQIPEQFL